VPPKPRREPPQVGPRHITVAVPAEVPYLLMGYKVPVLKTAEHAWEPYALEVLSGILDGGESARFARDLVRGQQVAAAADTDYDLYALHNDLFVIDATPAEGHTVDQVQKAIEAQIVRLQRHLVGHQELERIKAQVVAGQVYQRDSMFYQAMQIGILETVGLGWRRLDEYVDRIRAVTPEQVRAVARKYFVDRGLTVAVLKPLALSGKKPRGPAARPGGVIDGHMH
jgi:zinc protease